MHHSPAATNDFLMSRTTDEQEPGLVSSFSTKLVQSQSLSLAHCEYKHSCCWYIYEAAEHTKLKLSSQAEEQLIYILLRTKTKSLFTAIMMKLLFFSFLASSFWWNELTIVPVSWFQLLFSLC